jgi:putative FmdB family regulatory protein
MPIYRYVCSNCGHEEKVIVLRKEDEEVKCPECGADMEKGLPKSVGVKFKGSGFYSTDSKQH